MGPDDELREVWTLMPAAEKVVAIEPPVKLAIPQRITTTRIDERLMIMESVKETRPREASGFP